MPSIRAAATWQSETAIVPSARTRYAASLRSSATSRTQRGSADSMPTSSSLPSAARRSPRLGGEGDAVEGRAGAAAGGALLVGPEVVDEAEDDVAHRRPVGDGDRDRVVGEAALGVDRAVDRVDDHDHAGVAVVDLPALLADRGEARAVGVQAVELGEHGALGVGVDLQRAVAAAADVAGLEHALGGRRARAQDRPQGGGRAPGRPEPVRLQRRVHGPHRMASVMRGRPRAGARRRAGRSARRAAPGRGWRRPRAR